MSIIELKIKNLPSLRTLISERLSLTEYFVKSLKAEEYYINNLKEN